MRPDQAADDEGTVVYRRRSLSLPVTVCWVGMTLIFLAQTAAHDSAAGHLISASLAAISAVVAARARRMATILANPDGIIVRGFARTKRIPRADVVRFLALPRRSGAGRSGHTLAVEVSDGHVVLFGEFFSPKGSDGPASVERIAASLNDRYVHGANPANAVPPEQ